MDLSTASTKTFAGRVGEHFRLQIEGMDPIDLVLVDCQEYRADIARPPKVGRRQPFSLYFLGPLGPVLPQRMYSAVHDALGAMDLFFVPIGQDDRGTTYEVVFG